MAKILKEHNYHGIDATVICDSINEFDNRLTSFVLTFPRIVLSEFNTHRLFSRNSASSRAIPINKMLQKVKDNPFIPIKFMKNHKGMQGGEYLTGVDGEVAKAAWYGARDSAIEMAVSLADKDVTKQLVNRILEPFMWHTVILTASELDNYFELRDHPAAEIHIADLARKMKVALEESIPKKLKANEWHVPFGDTFDDDKLTALLPQVSYPPNREDIALDVFKRKIAVARCARVSYDNFDGSNDYSKDLILYDRLSAMGHWSPFEHVAQAMDFLDYSEDYIHIEDGIRYHGCCRNFKGFIQLRANMD